MNKLLSLAIFVLINSSVSFSYDKAIQKLLSRHSRPTLADYIEAYDGKLPNKNPLTGEYQFNYLKENVYDISKVLVYLAKVSPNYTFFPMGRDSYYVADVAEAFWLSKGVSDKVRRINGSGDSIYPDYRGKRDTVLADYMEQIGWEYQKGSPSAVLFDNTGGGFGTQLGNLSQAMVRRILESNPKIKESTLKQMLIGFSTGAGEYLESDFNMKGFNTNHKNNEAVYDLIQVGSLRGYMYDTAGEWHESFSKFSRGINGKIIENPGRRHSKYNRKYVLWRHYEILKIMLEDKGFEKNLLEFAKEYGVSKDRLYQKEARFKDSVAFLKNTREKLLDFSAEKKKNKKNTIIGEFANNIQEKILEFVFEKEKKKKDSILRFYRDFQLKVDYYIEDNEEKTKLVRQSIDVLMALVEKDKLSTREVLPSLSSLSEKLPGFEKSLLDFFELRKNEFLTFFKDAAETEKNFVKKLVAQSGIGEISMKDLDKDYFEPMSQKFVKAEGEKIEEKTSSNTKIIAKDIAFLGLHENNNEVMAAYLELILMAKEKEFLGARDVRKLVGKVIENVRDTQAFAYTVESLLKSSGYLRKTWAGHDYFEDSKRTKSEKVVENYGKISSLIPFVSSKSLYCGQLVLRKLAI